MGVARPVLVAILVIGVLARVAAVAWNDSPHGDVHLDVLTLQSLVDGEGLVTPLERSVELYPREDPAARGYPLDQHPPLALLVAAPLQRLVGDTYLASRLASLLAGLALIGVVFLLGSRLVDRVAGSLAASLVALSFLLADFSGNGSIYTLHALLCLVAILALTRADPLGAFLAGGALGLAYLTNYQAVVCLAAVLGALVCLWLDPRHRAGRLRDIALVVLGFALVAAPWWLRNHAVFGEPGFSVNPIYAKAWFGGVMSIVEQDGGNRLAVADPGVAGVLRSLKGILVVNLRSLGLQAPWWLASLLGAAAMGVAAALLRTRASGHPAPLALALMALCHIGASVGWPAMKFRYLVPWVPMLALLAVYPCRQASTVGARRLGWLCAVAFTLVGVERLLRGAPLDGAMVLLAVAAFVAPPLVAARGGRPIPALWVLLPFAIAQANLFVVASPKTTYYDGILVSDAFGRRGQEAADRAKQERLARIARRVEELDIDALIADIELKHHLREIGSEARVIQPILAAVRDDAALDRVLASKGVLVALTTTPDEAAFYEAHPRFAGERHRETDGDGEWRLIVFR